MNLIQFRLIEGKPTFWGLVDAPNNAYPSVKDDSRSWYNQTFKLCEEKALRIVNSEVLELSNPIHFYSGNNSLGLKHNDTFSIPEGWEFKEEYNHIEEKHGIESYKVIRLAPSSKESEKEIWAAFVRAWSMRTPLTELKKMFTIQRKK